MGTKMSRIGFGVACIVGLTGFLAPARATEQVYHPISPTFGGSPANGPFLLSTAQGQGEGVNSGNQGPNLSGLTNALGGAGGTGGSGTTIIIPSGSTGAANTMGIPAKP
jgi:curli production assembly/transport component CsgF